MGIVAVAGSTYPIEFPLSDQATAGKWKTSPTIAAGDFKRSIVTAAGTIGAYANLDNLPTVSPSGSPQVAFVLSAAETTAAGVGGHINILGQDQAGNEWSDIFARIDVDAAPLSTFNSASNTVTLAAATHTGAVIPTVSTVTNLTNAPTAGDLTAAMKTSVQTAATAATPTAAAVTGNVGGNVVGSVASVTAPVTVGTINADVITAASLATSAVNEIVGAMTAPATPANVTAATSAVLTAIAALNNLSTTDLATMANAIIDAQLTSDEIATELMATAVEGSHTLQRTLRIMLAALAGLSTGGGTPNPAFRDAANTKNRIAATVDTNGNRTAITLDGA